MQNQPILFYSTRCSHSKQILDTMKALNKDSLFRMFPIDGKSRAELPPFLQSVPTLYLPETKDVYKGKDIYAYIAKPVVARREIPTQQTPTQTPQTLASQGQIKGNVPAKATDSGGVGDFKAWSFGSSGFSDAFSSWDTPNNFGDDQLHYTFLGGTNATPAPTEPAMQSQSKNDGGGAGAKNSDVAARMEALQKQRDSEFVGIARK